MQKRWVFTLFSLLFAAACAGKGGNAPGAQSPERQSDAEYDLARAYFEKGEVRLALEHVRRSIALNDENARSLYFASVVHLFFCSGSGGLSAPDCRLDEAEKYARRAVDREDAVTLRDAKNTLAAILILEKRYAEAISTLEPLVRDPAYTATHLGWGNLGWAQVLSGKVEQGISSLRNAVAATPQFCVGHYRLGVAYERKGEFELAENSLTNAVSVESPDCRNLQDAWHARARVRMRLGKATDAKADLTKCRDIAATSTTGKTCGVELEDKP